jgi:penicillin-binding protein 1C
LAVLPVSKQGLPGVCASLEKFQVQTWPWRCWLLGCVLLFGMAGTVCAMPSYEQVKAQYRASDVILLDRNGQPLQRLRTDYQGRRGDWLAIGDISPAFQEAVLLSEDKRFYSHDGIDWRAIGAAAWDIVTGHGRRGASTVTMQLTGLIDEPYQRRPQGRSLRQKIDQMLLARELEHHWSKPQILEAYLNLVSFRGELVGVDALARVLFQKHASGLNARESALAAVMLRGPNASPKLLGQRSCALLRQMEQPQECEGLAAFVRASLRRVAARRADSQGLAPHFARWVMEQEHPQPGARLKTSLDADLQRFAIQSMQRHLQALKAGNIGDGAVVVFDNATGQVLAYVGSSGELSSSAWVDHVRARRQAGSTLKPFLYSQAIEQERLTAVSLLEDGPLGLPTGNGLYIPQNYDKRFSGWVSVRTALASSLNIPAVRTLALVTPDAFQQRLVNLGLPLDRTGDFYGYSLALGSADVSLLTLGNAYRALANEGRYSPPAYLPAASGAESSSTVVSPAAAWIVGDILSDRHARARTFGLDSPLATRFWTAVKTGTSKDMRDNWCMGWSQRYTVGVWVGNSSGASMRDVSGVSGAGPIWHDIMNFLHRRVDSKQPEAPAGVVARHVVFDSGLEPARTDYFVGDTAVSTVRARRELKSAAALPSIASPVGGTIVALDPDIPPENQKLLLQAKALAAGDADAVQWRVDGRPAGTGGRLMWTPWPGRHNVELLDAEGRVRDSAAIEVRGAALKSLTSRPRG